MKNFKALALTLLATTTLGLAAPKAEAANITPINFNGEYVGQYNCNDNTFKGANGNRFVTYTEIQNQGAPAFFVDALFTAGQTQCAF